MTSRSNARHEGLNRRVRLIINRAYGFHSARAALGLIMLTLDPIEHVLPHGGPGGRAWRNSVSFSSPAQAPLRGWRGDRERQLPDGRGVPRIPARRGYRAPARCRSRADRQRVVGHITVVTSYTSSGGIRRSRSAISSLSCWARLASAGVGPSLQATSRNSSGTRPSRNVSSTTVPR